MLIQVAFHEGGRPYTYEAPDTVQVGDEVKVPVGNAGAMKIAEVIALGSTYTGPVKMAQVIE